MQPFHQERDFGKQKLLFRYKEFFLRHQERQHHITQQFVFRQKWKFSFKERQLRFKEQFLFLQEQHSFLQEQFSFLQEQLFLNQKFFFIRRIFRRIPFIILFRQQPFFRQLFR